MRIKTMLLAAAVATAAAGTSMAATLTHQYDVTSAVGSGSDHSIWIKSGIGSIGSDFDFKPAGQFSMYDNGTATLTGSVESQNTAGSGFKVSFNYDSKFKFTPQFKSENGSKAVPGQTFFRDLQSGTLTGYGALAGLVMKVSRMPNKGPYATQIGPSNGVNNGANNKNKNYGMAHWFDMRVLKNNCKVCTKATARALNKSQGDVNVDLEGGPIGGQIPLPASGLLLVGGLAGLAGLRRKRRS